MLGRADRRAAGRRAACGALGAALLAGGGAWAPARSEATIDQQDRLRSVRAEIERLDAELERLSGRERGLLGELERLDAEQRLREAERAEAGLRLEQATDAIAGGAKRLEELNAAQRSRREYLEFRLREIYKDGPDSELKRLIGGGPEEEDRYGSALRYEIYLGERDARILADYEHDRERIDEEERALIATREELAGVVASLDRAAERLGAARSRRERLLRDIRTDSRLRRDARVELEAAAESLSRVVGSVPADASPVLEMGKFKGLLDPPADGRVTEGFGTAVHPKFQTEVPHPGWDIEAEAGTDFRAVFDGRVVFSTWMRGYGLTAIVDHGGGLISIYAHASVLLVEAGEPVLRGQALGKIGDTDSSRGPYLYFELRDRGKPVDPAGWLRRP